MNLPLRRIIPILLFLPLIALQAQLVDPNVALIAAAGTAKDFPTASTVIVYDSTTSDVMETGLSYVTMHKLTKALTPAGAKELRSIAINYDPLSAGVEVKFVRIYRTDGTTEIIGADRVVDYPAPARAIYWGARDKTIEVGRLDVGDAVETIVFRKGFTYALLASPDDDSKFIPPMRGHFYDIVEFFTSVPTKEKVYRVFMPKNKPLQYEVFNGELTSYVHFPPEKKTNAVVLVNPHVKVAANADWMDGVKKEFNNKIEYCWWKRNLMPMKNEPQMVAASDVATKLLVSTSPDWYAKAVWFHRVNEDYKSFAVTPDVKKIVDKLLAGVKDEMEKISILTHWAAEEIRYSGISMGPGEGYTLHKGSMTFLDRCGVCKDKAGMLITMLRAAGFESYPAMTMAGSRIDRIPADQFNHSVTVVKKKSGEWILLDPTWVPGVRELWSSAEQQQEFLMGIPGGANLMTTPISPAENHYWKLTGASSLNDDGTLEGTLTLEAEGQSDAMIRRAFQRSFMSSWKEYLARVMYEISPQAVLLENSFVNPYDIGKPMQVKLKYRIPNYAVVTAEKIHFIPLLARNPFSDGTMSGEMYTDTGLTKRDFGFRMRCSKLVEISETVALPSHKSIVSLPEFKTVKGPASSFTAAYTREQNMLTFRSTHRMEKRIYEASDWNDFREGLMERMRTTVQSVVLAK